MGNPILGDEGEGCQIASELQKQEKLSPDVTVESEKVDEFSNNLTPPVAAAVPEAVGLIRNLLIESYSDQASTEKYHTN